MERNDDAFEKRLEDFYLQQNESTKDCMLAMRDILLRYNKNITNVLKYNYPFFCYKGKMFAYLSFNKKHKQPYLGMVDGHQMDHPALVAEKRTRIKILLLDTSRDLPIKTIKSILKLALHIHESKK